MGKGLLTRGEVIMAGLGGGGVLTAGTLLAEAATTKYKNVSWFPSYDISKRGGLVECTVIFSNDEIASPLLDQADSVVVAEAAQFKNFLSRVRPGGTMVTEVAGLQTDTEREDITLLKVSAIETAIAIGGTSQGANLVLLGVLIEATEIIPAELVEQELQKSFTGKEKALKNNLEAFRRGLDIIRRYPWQKAQAKGLRLIRKEHNSV